VTATQQPPPRSARHLGEADRKLPGRRKPLLVELWQTGVGKKWVMGGHRVVLCCSCSATIGNLRCTIGDAGSPTSCPRPSATARRAAACGDRGACGSASRDVGAERGRWLLVAVTNGPPGVPATGNRDDGFGAPKRRPDAGSDATHRQLRGANPAGVGDEGGSVLVGTGDDPRAVAGGDVESVAHQLEVDDQRHRPVAVIRRLGARVGP